MALRGILPLSAAASVVSSCGKYDCGTVENAERDGIFFISSYLLSFPLMPQCPYPVHQRPDSVTSH